MTTLNQILDVFKAYQELPDSLLNDFGYGPTDNIGNSVPMKFPYLWVTHTQSSTIQLSVSGNKTMTPIYRFTLLIVDQLNDSKNIKDLNGQDAHNGQELVSDCWQIAQDIVNFLHTSPSMRALNISLEAEDPAINPLFDETDDKVNGVTLDLAIRTTYGCITAATITGQCYPVIVTNSNESFNASFTSGSTNVLEDIVVTVGGGAVLNKPAAVDLNLQDYYYVGFPTGTRQPNFTVANPNTQVLWLDSYPVNGNALTLGKIEAIPLVGFPDVAYRSSYFSIATLGDFKLEGRPRKGTNIVGGTGYETTFGFGNRFLNNQNLGAYDFAFYSYQTGPTTTLIAVRENGVSVFSVNSNVTEPMLRIDRVGIQVRFYVNNTLIWTSYYPSSDPLSRGYAMGGVLQSFVGNYTEDIKVTYL